MATSVFHEIDRLRRWGGEWLEAASPRREQPHRVLWEDVGVRLREYEQAGTRGPTLFLVPAPIKRSYIWDLSPESSVVAHAQREGFQVFLAEWTEAPADYGIAQYAELLARCAEAIRRRTRAPLHLATHSLGGVLSVAYAAQHPDEAASLALIETPLHFGDGTDAFAPVLAVAPPGEDIAARFGNVPGSFIGMAAVNACPGEFEFERYADLAASAFNPQDLRTHMQIERWAMDEFALPGALYAQVVNGLYREDQLMRGGFLLGERPIGPQDLTVPLLSVFDPWCRVVPPASVIAFHQAAASAEKRLLAYRGEVGVALRHVGALVGRHAHERLWPEIFAWLKRPSSRH